MTVYTTVPQDDSNLDVTLTESNDLVTLDITPAAVSVSGAVSSVNGQFGAVVLDTDDIAEGTTNLYSTDVRIDARVDLQTGANLDLSFQDTDDLAEGVANLYYTEARVDSNFATKTTTDLTEGTNLYSKQPNAITDDVTFNTMTADMYGVQHFIAKAREAISAGQPVYISGHSGNTPEVMVADYADPAKMPAFGIASADIANNNNGDIATAGDLKNIDTTGTSSGETWAVGDTLYVDGSNLTNDRPQSETQAIQSLAKVIRVHANVGQMFLSGAGRVNDVPNLDHYHVFIGNAGGVEKRQLNYNTDILNTPSLAAYITASSTDTLTNKSGSNSQWTNTEAYIKADSTDTLTNKSGAISQWTNDSAYLTASALTPYYTSTQVDALPVSTFTNDAGYSTTTGTVTPSSTDTFTNKSGAISQWTNDSGYLTAETDSQTLSFTSPNLTISNGNFQDLSSLEVAGVDGGTY